MSQLWITFFFLSSSFQTCIRFTTGAMEIDYSLSMRWWVSIAMIFLLQWTTVGQVTIVIESLPEATPPEDTIFISGTFNDWAVNDPAFMMSKRPNGQLFISLQVFDTSQEFKFTRGSWMKVETDNKNEYLPNRVLQDSQRLLTISIANWQDLGGARRIPRIIFYYFAIAFQCAVLLLLVRRLKKTDVHKVRVIHKLNLLLLLYFVGVVLYFQVNLIYQTYITLLAQTLLFFWPPIFYELLKVFSDLEERHALRPIHYLPVILVAAVSILRLFNVDMLAFLTLPWKGHLSWEIYLYKLTGSLVLMIYLIIGWTKCSVRLRSTNRPEVSFLWLVILVNLLIAVVILLEIALTATGSMITLNVDHTLVLMALSLIVLLETYYVWKHPEMLREMTISAPVEGLEEVAHQISTIMATDKVYRNPELSVAELSKLLGVQKHIISRALNDHFHKNFRDYVNEYRIKEFIDLAKSGKLEQFTYLALAHEVGFNSKSTFNLAFKKYTSETPRDFFKSQVFK